MILSKMNCSRGAPMGRIPTHHCGSEGLKFELEWVPFIDGGYDYGGAYWGSPDNLYAAQADDGDERVSLFLRAASREEAMATLTEQHPGSTFEPENGSLIKETIKFLEEYSAGESDLECVSSAEDDISDLKSLLEEKGLLA